jgi:hypothetical protein
VEVCLDRRQRDGHDRRVQDHHELAEAHDGQGQPSVISRSHDRHYIMTISEK